LSQPMIKVLIPSNKENSSFIENMKHKQNIEINFIDENDHSVVFLIIDKQILFFSEMAYSDINMNKQSNFNIVSNNESQIWYNVAIFESLWKQSVLVNKIGKLYVELEQNNNSNSNLMRIIAHEIKSPIQSILGLSEIVESNTRLNSEQKNELLKIMFRNTRKLDLLTNNILDYARFENNLFDLNLESFDIIKLIEELIDDYRLDANKKEVVIEHIYQENPLFISADRLRMMEVIDNLLHNSIKFTDNGHISIYTKIVKNNIMIEISDTGCGIPEKSISNVFSKFFTTDKLGTGLGLFISKTIVEKHGGKINVKNNHQQRGCTFFVEIPSLN
ncbi:MAG: HAMP domain-containing histidine kinase, partial [Nitrosopumilus sp.]|nr:HAMP domain-containing histidine kinase [Nitrosopumilus sp.]